MKDGFEICELTASGEELRLRRQLLFRLLRDFDFARPAFHGEAITPPIAPELAARMHAPA